MILTPVHTLPPLSKSSKVTEFYCCNIYDLYRYVESGLKWSLPLVCGFTWKFTCWN